MYLKRLEIKGFKSFPEKISLNFTKGITAVVGPNGSGKSNITDAVRWVLGEQSAKSLRGGKMEDIIFAGTQNRKPLGFAEVSLVIDNQDFRLPIDFSEITVTRRVFRSGDSEYKINGTACRLRDIHELFMDTGIGKEGYSIIGQGRIEGILSSRGEDRRFLFEEATGIVKYRTRRDSTLSKIQRERENLIRLEDIILELENNLEPLQEQSEKARKYLELVNELKKIHINIFLIDSKRTEKDLKALTENIENIQRQLSDESNKKEFIMKKIEELKLVLEEKENNSKTINNEVAELRSQIEQKDNDVKLIYEKNNYIERELERLKEEEALSEKNIVSLEKKNNNEKEKLSNLKRKLNENNKLLLENEDKFRKLNRQIKEREDEFEKYNSDIIELYQKDSIISSNLAGLSNQLDSYNKRQDEILKMLYDKKEIIENKDNEVKEFSDKLHILNKETGLLNKEIELNEEENSNLYKIYTQIKYDNSNISMELNEVLSKYKIIKELENDYEGYYSSVKSILKDKEYNQSLKGIHGAVGELIEVPEKLETAMEIALGGYMQNIVTETEQDAKQAIGYLKKNKKGRATFLPISVIKKRELSNQEQIVQNTGVVGIASNLINYENKYDDIVKNILGKVIICDNIDNAIALSKKYGNTFKIVTLDGELLNIGGSLTGGSIYKKSANIFGRSRQLKELTRKLKSLEKLKKELEEKEVSAEKELSIVVEKVKNGKEILIKNENKLVILNQNLLISKNHLNDIKEIDKQNRIEERQLNEQILHIKSEIAIDTKKINKIKKTINFTKTYMEEFQNTALHNQETKDDSIKQLTDIKVEISSIIGVINATEESVERYLEEIVIIENEQEIKKHKLKQQQNQLNDNTHDIEKSKLAKKELISLQKEKLVIITNLSKELDEINKALVEYDKNERSQLETVNTIEKEKTRLEFKQEQVEEKRKNLFDTMWEEYEMTYQQALKYSIDEEDINKLYKYEKKYKNQIKELGNINPNSIEEYKETKERYDFLTEQRNDILVAEEKLQELIMELTELMSKQFIDQFKIISDNFNTVFKEMFEGGKAYLQLSDKDNVLESDIEIIAQPPGKNLQNMNLLSGGERALTAIALLFGILKMKPSPFCILDEIEAALDESNVRRFSEYILKLSDEIQFIIITHRKGTMEVADVLYGVTMEEQGISKLVSVELESVEEKAL